MSIPLRVAVIGAGAFGRNHLRVLHELQQATLISNPTSQQHPAVQLTALVDPHPAHSAEAATRYNIAAFATVNDLLAAGLHLDAAIVAVPTIAHAQVATQLIEANLDVLVEKPLTATLTEADALIALAARRHRILAAGHLERFNPAVTAALAALTRPMFFEAHRLSVFTPRSLDVDVVHDLMIHDLDILLTMARSPVTEIRAVGLPILSPKTDIANVRLEFASGAIANLTASRVSTEQVRKLRLFQPAQYLSLDYARQELLTINVAPTLADATMAPLSRSDTTPTAASSRPEVPPIAASSRPEAVGRSGETPVSRSARAEGTSQPPNLLQPHPSPGLTFDKLAPPRAEPLRLELEDFLHAVHTRTPPRVTATAARNALALALDITAAIATHATRTGLH